MAKNKKSSSFSNNMRCINATFNDTSKWLSDKKLKLPRASSSKAAQALAETPIGEIAKLKATDPNDMKQMSKILSTLQRSFTRRADQFINAGIYSHAVQSVLDQSPISQTPSQIIKNSSNVVQARNKMLREIVIYQKFFSDQTSSLRGAYDVMNSQAKRIFGVNKKGIPVYMPNQMEWKKFWSIYNEYNNIYKTDNSNLYSSLVQQSIAYIMQNNYTGSENFMDTLDAVHREVHNRLDQENAEEYASDWSDFTDATDLPY